MIGVTLGDPAGVGPEIVAKSLSSLDREELVLVGNRANFLRIVSDLHLDVDPDGCEFVDIPGGDVQYGRIQKAAGEIAVRSVEKAVELAEAGRIESMATAPINKEAMVLAGSRYIDHTSMLSGLTGARVNHTVFEVGALRIFFMTKHVSLAEACSRITESLVYTSILDADYCLRLLDVPRRRIAVAGLNPHAGDGGLFGNEEIEQISPALERAKRAVDVSGPYPADSVFHRAADGDFDIVVALYHDQGHIAAKMLDFHRTVSLNLGLPFLRTSVDHGTAFDIAGKNLANPLSMVEAVKKAAKYGKSYRSRFQQVK